MELILQITAALLLARLVARLSEKAWRRWFGHVRWL